MKFKTLDLFSGLGGFSLGLERTGYFETIAFCDNDKYSKLIIDKHWKGAKIYNDVREINKEQFKKDGIEFPEIITGGFPCQPFSVAGKKQGTNDDRHLWPEMFRIIQEFTPRWIIGENVKNITNIQDGMVFETVCTDLEGEGYEVRAFNIPAAGVGAPHRRERIWIVAHSKSIESDVGRGRQHQEERERQLQIRGKNSDDANTDSERLQGHRSEYELRNSEEEEQTSGNSWWSVEPNVGRVANGVSGRVYRLKGLGNSIVPKIAEEIGKAIVEAENEME
jgi:DNA (cytosine-5)-methyltransferase 1